eukprot:732717-Prorocentrum_minimum.AAC.2
MKTDDLLTQLGEKVQQLKEVRQYPVSNTDTTGYSNIMERREGFLRRFRGGGGGGGRVEPQRRAGGAEEVQLCRSHQAGDYHGAASVHDCGLAKGLPGAESAVDDLALQQPPQRDPRRRNGACLHPPRSSYNMFYLKVLSFLGLKVDRTDPRAQ